MIDERGLTGELDFIFETLVVGDKFREFVSVDDLLDVVMDLVYCPWTE